MSGMSDLEGLTLATVRRAPHHPMILVADGIATVPELGRYASIGAVAQHPAELAVLDFVADFRTKLEIVAPIIDAPGAIGVHEDTLVRVGDEVIQAPVARLDADVGHANEWGAIPARGAHAAV